MSFRQEQQPPVARRVMGPNDDLVTTGDADESLLTDSTRDVTGASYYWVMDLAGSVWERVITFGHPRGRTFQGTHGDGTLSGYGDATNTDWPSGDQEAGGYGYRGGGYYEESSTPATGSSGARRSPHRSPPTRSAKFCAA